MPTAAYPAVKRARIESREARLKELGHKDYNAYLSSAAWRSLKARYRASDLVQDCGLCSESDGLDMHHMTYERVGEEELSDLIPLCRNCHRMVHVLEERGEIGLDFSGLVDFQRAARYAVEQQARKEQARKDIRDAERTEEQLLRLSRTIISELKYKLRRLPQEEALDLAESLKEQLKAVKVADDTARKRPEFNPLNPATRRSYHT